jgi:hypothetical protein
MKTLATRITNRLVTAQTLKGGPDKITKAIVDQILKHPELRSVITDVISYGVELHVDNLADELGVNPNKIEVDITSDQLKSVIQILIDQDDDNLISSVTDSLSESFQS